MADIINREDRKAGFLTVSEVTFTAEHVQKPKTWSYLNAGFFVAGLIFNKKRKTFIFVRQYRIAVTEHHDDPLFMEVVAGMHDQETLEDTMWKEVQEELHMKFPRPSFEFVDQCYSSPGTTSEVGTFFYTEIDIDEVPPEFGGKPSENELTMPVEYSIEEVIVMLNGHKILDTKTVLLLNWWLAYKADWNTVVWARSLKSV